MAWRTVLADLPMAVIGLFFGSTGGATAKIARLIEARFAEIYAMPIDLIDVGEVHLDEMEAYDCLILGIPTWNVGQLQSDWEQAFAELDTLDLGAKPFAMFGLGDQVGYPSTFADAMFFLADKMRERGGTLVGRWPTSGYSFEESWAVEDGRFIGLVLDEENQQQLTPDRVAAWCDQLWREFGLDQRGRCDQ